MIPDAKIAEIRQRADIAEVVAEYVALRRAGANLKGVCPFHADSDPSFNVNPARQFYHCFGCGASGDVFSFVERIEGIDFTETARRLASRYGIELAEFKMTSAARSQAERAREARTRRRFILEEATRFFESRLAEPEGQQAVKALEARGVSESTARMFRLGCAPAAWSSLTDDLKKKNISPKELEEVGLSIERQGGGYYDRFRNRLVFTITDPGGAPIAFSGRALGDDPQDRAAKYINSPETPEYAKGQVLFGLYQARVPLTKYREAILVEGNFDVVTLFEAGFENVLAPLGTALTREQALLLRRRVERVVLLFDGDGAGRAAAHRAFPVLAAAGLASYVVTLPQGEDPDSFVRRNGAPALRELLSKKTGLLDQIISDSVAACDGSAQDIARRIERMAPFIREIRNSTEIDVYRAKIADGFKVPHETVFRVLRGLKRGESEIATPRSRVNPVGQAAERELIGVLFDFPELLQGLSDRDTISLLTTPAIKAFVEEMERRFARKELFVADLVSKITEDPLKNWIAERAMVRLYKDEDRARRALDEIRVQLVRTRTSEEIRELEKQIQLAGSRGEDMRVLELSRKKADLQRASALKTAPLFDAEMAKA